MARPSLEALSTYGGAALVVPTDGEFAAESPVNVAAAALNHYRLAAERFMQTKAEIERSTRFSAEGRAAELGDYAARALNELGRTDVLLSRAQAQRDELQSQARKVPLDLSVAQAALLPQVYARLAECEPLELPGLLVEAAEARDVLTLAAFLQGPTSKTMRLAVSAEQLDAAREAAAGPLPGDQRKLLDRLRELVAASENIRKAMVKQLREAAGLEQDPITLAAFGAEQDKPANDDPIASMATGKAA